MIAESTHHQEEDHIPTPTTTFVLFRSLLSGGYRVHSKRKGQYHLTRCFGVTRSSRDLRCCRALCGKFVTVNHDDWYIVSLKSIIDTIDAVRSNKTKWRGGKRKIELLEPGTMLCGNCLYSVAWILRKSLEVYQ